jgi:hypothetical protein
MFETLPLELILTIFNNLNDEDLQNIRLVCRLFYYATPIIDVLIRKFKSWTIIMQHTLIFGNLEMFQYLSEFIKPEDIKHYAFDIHQNNTRNIDNSPDRYSPILIKEFCSKYCNDLNEINDMFCKKRNIIIISCMENNRFDVLKDIYSKYNSNKKIKLSLFYCQKIICTMIENKQMNYLIWFCDIFKIKHVHYEDIIVSALMTNDMEYILFVDNNFTIFSYDSLMEELNLSEFNYDRFDTLIINNYLDAFQYICNKLKIYYRHGVLVCINEDILDFAWIISECEEKGYYDMVKYIRSLYKKENYFLSNKFNTIS